MGRIQFITLVILGVVGLLGFNSMFIVDQRSQAVVVQFGAIQQVYNAGDVDEAGLKFKMPWQNVEQFDKRNLFLDLPEQTVTAGNASDDQTGQDTFNPGGEGSNEQLVVDAFARWRITNPALFYQRVRTEEGGKRRITGLLQATTREVLGGVPSSEIISGQRADLMEQIRVGVADRVVDSQLGVEIIDVRIKRVELPEANREQVFARMVSERRQEASGIRANGREQAARIEADADAQVTRIRADATELNERIRGAGDGQAAQIYASAYGVDPEFFAFYRSLQSYEQVFQPGTQVILSPDDEFFAYFGNQDGEE